MQLSFEDGNYEGAEIRVLTKTLFVDVEVLARQDWPGRERFDMAVRIKCSDGLTDELLALNVERAVKIARHSLRDAAKPPRNLAPV